MWRADAIAQANLVAQQVAADYSVPDTAVTVTVDAPDMGWRLRVAAWEADEIAGDVLIADPDGIVEEVRHSTADEAPGLLAFSPPWVHTPVGAWLRGEAAASYQFLLRGTQRGSADITRVG